MHHALATALALLAAPALAAEPLVTDRPDTAESSEVLPRGGYQLEQGVHLAHEGEAGPALRLPELHRLGVGAGLELRVETPLVVLRPARRPAFEELGLGLKWHLLDGGAWGEAPSVGVLAHAVVGAGGAVAPVLKLALDTALPWDVGLGLNVGGTWEPGVGPGALWALSVSRPVLGALRAYVEGAGGAGAGGADVTLDGGLALLLGDDVQLDAAVGRTLGGGPPVWSATLGVSVRFGVR